MSNKSDDDLLAKRYTRAYLLLIAFALIFPPTAPIVAAVLLSSTGLPASAAAKWACHVLTAGIISGALVVVAIFNRL